MQQLDSESIARVESFLIAALFKYPDAAVREHAVTIHQKQFDASRTFLNF